LEIVLKITYHMQQSSVCFDEIMQFHQRCLGPTVLQNKLVVIGMTHLMLGWRDQMKLVSIMSYNHAVNVP
jgi:hypothetical protein